MSALHCFETEEKQMRFRPCIDIHNGKVKQIVGGSLRDARDEAKENFVSEQDAAFYAKFYQEDGLKGGHVILLNPASSPYYEETKRQALTALAAYPGGLQLGGGINETNATAFLEAARRTSSRRPMCSGTGRWITGTCSAWCARPGGSAWCWT